MKLRETLKYRATIYKFLSIALSYMDDKLFRELKAMLDKVSEAYLNLNIPESEIIDRFKADILNDEKTVLRRLRQEYTRLFITSIPLPCPPYESAILEGRLAGESTTDILKYYQKLNVEVSDEFRDMPDHIAAELEFLYYTTLLILEHLRNGRVRDAAQICEIQSSFLENHVFRWVDKLSDCMVKNSKVNFYEGIARLVSNFMEWERMFVKKLKAELDFNMLE